MVVNWCSSVREFVNILSRIWHRVWVIQVISRFSLIGLCKLCTERSLAHLPWLRGICGNQLLRPLTEYKHTAFCTGPGAWPPWECFLQLNADFSLKKISTYGHVDLLINFKKLGITSEKSTVHECNHMGMLRWESASLSPSIPFLWTLHPNRPWWWKPEDR